ncbi:hypothetical protein MASR2M47_26380 [Draconibacterium sp.]|jgi:hypothetical protein
MGKMKGLKIVLVVLAVVFVLVVVKLSFENGFKQDAANAVNAVGSNNFIIPANELENIENQFFVVDLNESGSSQFKNSLQIPFEELLKESSLQKIKNTDNKILLVSDENSIAIKAWVILNQLDIKNVFVLSNEENPEVLKYEFQPDTATKLESNSE